MLRVVFLKIKRWVIKMYDLIVRDKNGKITTNVGDVVAYNPFIKIPEVVTVNIGLKYREFVFIGIMTSENEAAFLGFSEVEIKGDSVTVRSFGGNVLYRGNF